MLMRGRNNDAEQWNLLNPDEPFETHHFNCDGTNELCTYWPIGYLPVLEYSMYDVAIAFEPSAELRKLKNIEFDFQVAYFNPVFTNHQMALRLVFTIASLLILCVYCTKVLCRIPAHLQHQLTFEQKGTLSLTFFLLFFNDPIYLAHIYKPSFVSFAFTEFASSIFVAALLIYWLRELAGFRQSRAAREWCCLKKAVFTAQGVNQCALVWLIFFFVLLVVDFMVLNCYYFVYLEDNPSLAGRFDINSDPSLDRFLAPIIVTACLLLLYYTQYVLALQMGFVRLFDKQVPNARKVGFVVGVLVHIFFVFCVIFGVFNRHFANGGVQIVAFTVPNLYIYFLVIMNWPVQTIVKEYDMKEVQEGFQAAQAQHNFSL